MLEFWCESYWLVSADGCVVKYRYSVFRRVVDYYSDNMTGEKDTEDAFDMRKPLDRDKNLKWIRENGEEHRVGPEDVF